MSSFLLKDLPRYERLLEASKRYPDLNPDAFEAFLHLLRTGDELFRVTGAYFARHNVSQGRFCVIMLLAEHAHRGQKGYTPAELAEQANCTRATMTGLIDTLERDGMVRREPDATDRRMMRVALTEQGYAFIQAIIPEHFRRINTLMSKLSIEEYKVLIGLLEKVVGQAAIVEPLTGSSAADCPISCPNTSNTPV